MTQDEVVEQVCAIVSMAWNAVDPKAETASDGFCKRCPFRGNEMSYRNEGKGVDFVRQAVIEKIKRDGLPWPSNFDEQGFELKGTNNDQRTARGCDD